VLLLTSSFMFESRPAVDSVSERVRFEGLAQANVDFVWRSLRRLGVSESDVADASQHVWMVVARKLGEIARERERSFLFGTCVRTAANYRRGKLRWARLFSHEEHEAPYAAPSVEAVLDQRLARELLDEALSKLPADLLEVFVLFECEEMSTQEISSLLDVPSGTVASRLRRAREEFRATTDRIRKRYDLGRGEPQ
jgi:RNA polymerase sigma-70 factor, ECF subfamily